MGEVGLEGMEWEFSFEWAKDASELLVEEPSELELGGESGSSSE